MSLVITNTITGVIDVVYTKLESVVLYLLGLLQGVFQEVERVYENIQEVVIMVMPLFSLQNLVYFLVLDFVLPERQRALFRLVLVMGLWYYVS